MSDNLKRFFNEAVVNTSAYHVQPSSGLLKLDAMEMRYPYPDEMKKALAANLELVRLNYYPNSKSSSLVSKIRSVFSIPDEFEIMLGNGLDELIQIILLGLLKPGAVVMAPTPTFVMYEYFAKLYGMKFVGVDLKADFSLDFAVFIEQIKAHNPAVIFLAYPNNPTANLFEREQIKQIVETTNGFVVFDEAYSAYADDSLLDMLSTYENTILLRTMSKLGLAGIRLGYMVTRPEWLRLFDCARMPYNVNVLTQATARFMLDQTSFIKDKVRRINASRTQLIEFLAGFPNAEVFASRTNFVLVRVSDANDVFARLRDDYKILVKNLHGQHPLLDNVLRITIGTEEENDRLKKALTEILAG